MLSIHRFLNHKLLVFCFGAAVVVAGIGIAAVAHADDTIVLRAERLLDVVEGRMATDAAVVVRGKHIAAVDPERLPAEAEVIDLGDMTLLPGLIDVNTHPVAPCPVDEPPDRSAWKRSFSLKTFCARVNARKALRAGFTTVRALNNRSTYPELIYPALATASERGWVEAPHVVPGAMVLSRADALPPGLPIPPGPTFGAADGVSEVVAAVRHRVDQGAKVIKVRATAGFTTPDVLTYSDKELRAIVAEAERLGVPVTAHAHGAPGIKAAVRAGVNSIVHGTFIDDEGIELMVEHGTWLIPTAEAADQIPPGFEHMDPDRQKAIKHMAAEGLPRHRKALEAGVKFAFGSDAPVLPHGENAREFRALIARGMSPLEAIRTATIHSAELLGLDDRGRIAEGLLADLVAVPGNPLDDPGVLRDVRFVMKAGRVYKHAEDQP